MGGWQSDVFCDERDRLDKIDFLFVVVIIQIGKLNQLRFCLLL